MSFQHGLLLHKRLQSVGKMYSYSQANLRHIFVPEIFIFMRDEFKLVTFFPSKLQTAQYKHWYPAKSRK